MEWFFLPWELYRNIWSGMLLSPFELSITAGGFSYLLYPKKSLRKPLVNLFKNCFVEEVHKSEDYTSSK